VHVPVVEDDEVITATASLELAKHQLGELRVFSPTALEAWYSLHRIGKPEHYFEFVEAVRKRAA